MTETEMNCGKCLSSLVDADQIECNECNLWWHKDCSRLSDGAFQLLSQSDDEWFCAFCITGSLNSTIIPNGNFASKSNSSNSSIVVQETHNETYSEEAILNNSAFNKLANKLQEIMEKLLEDFKISIGNVIETEVKQQVLNMTHEQLPAIICSKLPSLVQEQVETLVKKEVLTIDSELKEIRETVETLTQSIHLLNIQKEATINWQRRRDIMIKGVPYYENNTAIDMVIDIGKWYEMDLYHSDIAVCRYVQRDLLLVTFVHDWIRQTLLSRYYKKSDLKLNNINKDWKSDSRVYINENYSANLAKMRRMARKLVSEKKIVQFVIKNANH